jgi:thermitase
MLSRRAERYCIPMILTVIFLLVSHPPRTASQPLEPNTPSQVKRLPRHVPPQVPRAIFGEIIIKVNNSLMPQTMNAQQRDKVLKDLAATFRTRFDSETIATYPELGWVRIKVPPGLSTGTVMNKLSQESGIEYAVPNYAITLHAHVTQPPPDYLWVTHFESYYPAPYPNFSHLWGMDKIGMQQAWSLSHAQGGGAIVAILDTGVDNEHPDIKPNYHSGKVYCGSGIMDSDGHGTYVAGLIGARGDNWVAPLGSTNDNQFFVGVNRIAKIMAIKIACPEPTIVDAIAGISYAVLNGASVINGSWGLYDIAENDPYVVALKNAIEAGINKTLYVASAGNEDRSFDSCSYPKMWPQMFHLDNLIVVAATNPSDGLWVRTARTGSNPCQPTNMPDASNYGQGFVHLAAPGENLWSLLPRSQTTNTGNPIIDLVSVASGTSGAAPLVAGCAALLQSRQLAIHPGSALTPTQLKAILMTSGTSVSLLNQKVADSKRLNCFQALQSVTNTSPPASPNNLTVR